MSMGLVLLVATFFAFMGLVALVRPIRILRTVGVEVTEAAGRNEVRAVYGGFGIAISALLVATFYAPEIRVGALYAVAAALLGMAGGRVISAAIDRRYAFIALVYTVMEITLATMLLGALVWP